MQIEEVVGMSAAQLSAMTDEELKKHFDHYLIVTRPENSPKVKQKEQQVLAISPKFDQARKLAATLGIELPVFTSMKGKK